MTFHYNCIRYQIEDIARNGITPGFGPDNLLLPNANAVTNFQLSECLLKVEAYMVSVQ